MWLLSTQLRTLEHFPDSQYANYAILSHRWQLSEVSFSDIQSGKGHEKAGWSKLQQACVRAASDGFQYIWIDTCCIDVSSSAELSEAINSMYDWYRNAVVCYVHLYDVRSSPAHVENDLRLSSWFTRGWTLQEMIAPKRVEFYGAAWESLGNREALASTIHEITRVPELLLRQTFPLEKYSVAQRMSWAAGRETTRPEDRAYSLMGLLGVNMPMLYGEGDRAFLRLQEEILKRSADHSIFAWKIDPSEESRYHGLLARSPDQFAGCEQIVEAPPIDMLRGYMQTNIGIQITLTSRVYAANIYHVALNCEEKNKGRVGIFLGFPANDHPMALVGRRLHNGLDRVDYPKDRWRHHQIPCDFVVPQRPFPNECPVDPVYGFRVSYFQITSGRSALAYTLENGIIVLARHNSWDPNSRLLTMPTGTNGVFMAFAVRNDGKVRVIGKLGLDKGFRPWIWIAEHEKIPKPDGSSRAEVLTAAAVDDLAMLRKGGSERTLWGVLHEGFDFNGQKDFLDRRYVGHPLNGVMHLSNKEGEGKLIIMITRKSKVQKPIWNVEVNIVRDAPYATDTGAA